MSIAQSIESCAVDRFKSLMTGGAIEKWDAERTCQQDQPGDEKAYKIEQISEASNRTMASGAAILAAIFMATVVREKQKEILTMGVPSKSEIKGKINKAKGAAKETIGRAVGNRDLEREGSAERTKGSIQETVGKARRKVGDAVKDLAKTIRN